MTPSSSPSPATPPTRRARASRRWSTSWATTRRCPRTPGCRSTRPTGCTPYNAQIRAIQSALTASGQAGFKVGTVDKFQSREAPVVIYSMATSSADQAPRGMEFLYDLHRLNVATSRAQALAIIVASPDLIRVSCRTPQQMILANALCRAWETQG